MAVSGGQLATASGASAFAGANDEIVAWLDVLLKGKPEEQTRARTEIGMILEARGFTEDAEEAYWANVQARADDRRSYERLIALYQLRRDRLSESLVRKQLDEVFALPQPARPLALEAQAPPQPAISSLLSGQNGPAAPAAPEPARPAGPPSYAAPPATAPAPQPRPIRRLRSMRPADEPPYPAPAAYPAPTVSPASAMHGAPVSDPTPDAWQSPVARPTARPAPRRSEPAPYSPEPERPRPGRAPRYADPPERQADRPERGPVAPPARRSLASPTRTSVRPGMQAVRATDIVPVAPQSGRRRAQLAPHPGRASRRLLGTGGFIIFQPSTLLVFTLACFGVAALLVSGLLLAGWWADSRSGAAASGQDLARCADGAVRFPGATDPRNAVAAAYRQQGVDVEMQRPGSPRLTADQAEQVVGGWIGASLLLEHAGQPAPKLHEWLDAGSSRPTLANAMMSGRHLDAMLTADEWAEAQSWPATNCEGAFVRDPRNADLVRLVERVVAR